MGEQGRARVAAGTRKLRSGRRANLGSQLDGGGGTLRVVNECGVAWDDARWWWPSRRDTRYTFPLDDARWSSHVTSHWPRPCSPVGARGLHSPSFTVSCCMGLSHADQPSRPAPLSCCSSALHGYAIVYRAKCVCEAMRPSPANLPVSRGPARTSRAGHLGTCVHAWALRLRCRPRRPASVGSLERDRECTPAEVFVSSFRCWPAL